MMTSKRKTLCRKMLKKSVTLFPEISNEYKFCKICGDIIKNRHHTAIFCTKCAMERNREFVLCFCEKCGDSFEAAQKVKYCPKCLKGVRRKRIANVLRGKKNTPAKRK